VFDDLDETVRQLLIREVPLDLTEVDVSFDAPDREWSGRLSRPTINCFLYDVRESEDLRESAWGVSSDANNRTVTRHVLPMFLNTTYNVTVWARAPEDEHRLLWRVLHSLARFRAIPTSIAQGGLRDQRSPLFSRVARPEQTRTSAADLWQALDNRIRPSLTYVVTVAMDPNIAITSPMTFSTATRTGGMNGEMNGHADELMFIGGRVRNRKDGSSVPGARVRLTDRGSEAMTGSDGQFAFSVRRGKAHFEIEVPGRKPVRRTADVPSANYDIEV
jgi:hypothetical protein